MSFPSLSEKIDVAVIGAGVRSVSYLSNVPEAIRDRIRLVGVADPDARQRQVLAERFAGWGCPRHFDDGIELLRSIRFDAVVIGSYNNSHADLAIEAMKHRDAAILLEKPVAISLEQCQRLWASYQENPHPRIFIGFVLRYAPFFQAIKAMLQKGAVGQLLAIDADENLSQSITSGFFRAWRRSDELSGGFMVEKCCHDFDIFNFLTESPVVRVFSIAKRTHFVDRPREEHLRRFEPEAIRRIALDYSDIHTRQIFERTSDESMYTAPSDVPDHQAVMLELEDGTLINFMACHAQPRATRRLKIFGANGSLEGDIDRGELLHDIPHEDRLGARTERHPITFDETGHHGADGVINNAFWKAAQGLPSENLAGIAEGIEAVLIGIAAETSKHTGLPVDLEPLRRTVYATLQPVSI